MALWLHPQEQPFTTYRDPKTGRWITIKPAQPVQDIITEAPLYRDRQTGKWVAVKPTTESK